MGLLDRIFGDIDLFNPYHDRSNGQFTGPGGGIYSAPDNGASSSGGGAPAHTLTAAQMLKEDTANYVKGYYEKDVRKIADALGVQTGVVIKPEAINRPLYTRVHAAIGKQAAIKKLKESGYGKAATSGTDTIGRIGRAYRFDSGDIVLQGIGHHAVVRRSSSAKDTFIDIVPD